MRKFFDGIITFILTIIAIAILGITTYGCLEFFEIIKVPEQYSIIKFLDSKMEVIFSIQEYVETTLDVKDFEDIWNNKNTITVELAGNSVTTVYLEGEHIEEKVNIAPSGQNNFRYYDQLNEYSKKMYDALENEKEMLKTGNYTFNFDTAFNDLLHQENGTEILNNSFQLAVNAFSYDHPEIFYLDITKMYLLTESTKTFFSKTHRVSIGSNGKSYLYEQYTSIEDVNFTISQVEQIKNDIKQNLYGSEYDKIKYIHDYLVETTEYERTVESYNNYNIYGAFLNRRAVCEGYAKAFKYILDDLEIPCVIAFGVARNSSGQTESHAWNYVLLNNNWYAVDVTWDDPIILGIGYLSSDVKYKYFLKGANTFFIDHMEDGTVVDAGTFLYPTLASTDY